MLADAEVRQSAGIFGVGVDQAILSGEDEGNTAREVGSEGMRAIFHEMGGVVRAEWTLGEPWDGV